MIERIENLPESTSDTSIPSLKPRRLTTKKALELFGEFAKPYFKDAANGTKPPISDNLAILVIK